MAARPWPRPVSPSPSVVVALTAMGAPTAADSSCSHSLSVRADLRVVGHDLDGPVAGPEAGLGQAAAHFAQQGRAGGTGPQRLIDAENGAQIAQSGRAEKCVR